MEKGENIMASDRMTVFVKPLFGDTLSLEIDPSFDLKDVADTLSRSDPVTFPHGLTIVRFMDEDQKEMMDQSMLMVMVQEPLESIARVDRFEWRGQPAYRLRIRADRTQSMSKWSPGIFKCRYRRQFPQLFDICYYPTDKTFMLPFGGETLENLMKCVGKRAKRPATVLKGRGDGYILYRRDGVGYHEFDDDISRLHNVEERMDWSTFVLTDDAIQRISTMITQWISQQSF